MANVMQALSTYLAERKRELTAECEDKEAVAEVLREERDAWFRTVGQYERGAMVPQSVYRSFSFHCGREEASRTFRYAGNFAELANLPQRTGTTDTDLLDYLDTCTLEHLTHATCMIADGNPARDVIRSMMDNL